MDAFWCQREPNTAADKELARMLVRGNTWETVSHNNLLLPLFPEEDDEKLNLLFWHSKSWPQLLTSKWPIGWSLWQLPCAQSFHQALEDKVTGSKMNISAFQSIATSAKNNYWCTLEKISASSFYLHSLSNRGTKSLRRPYWIKQKS